METWSLFANGKTYVTITVMVDMREYHDPSGRSPFREWFDRLNAEASRKVTTALYRMGLGNFSNAKSVGGGIYECRIDFGPGYRVYFGRDGDLLVILLAGGTKQRQQNDIRLALRRWEDYKRRKKEQKDEE
jgi:putative addiction module killer protein